MSLRQRKHGKEDVALIDPLIDGTVPTEVQPLQNERSHIVKAKQLLAEQSKTQSIPRKTFTLLFIILGLASRLWKISAGNFVL